MLPALTIILHQSIICLGEEETHQDGDSSFLVKKRLSISPLCNIKWVFKLTRVGQVLLIKSRSKSPTLIDKMSNIGKSSCPTPQFFQNAHPETIISSREWTLDLCPSRGEDYFQQKRGNMYNLCEDDKKDLNFASKLNVSLPLK